MRTRDSFVKWTPCDRSILVWIFREIHYVDNFIETYVIHVVTNNDRDRFRSDSVLTLILRIIHDSARVSSSEHSRDRSVTWAPRTIV